MSLSHAYGVPPAREDASRLIDAAFDLGITHIDTAALYGFGRNESLLGEALKGRRGRVVLASKCGMTGVEGRRVIDGRPETLLRTCDESLARLQTDHLDLYYLHRVDRGIPVEESVGAMTRLVEQGKIRAIGLSEVSAATLGRAHAVHPIAAVQSEYSLWSRNVEIGVLEACRNIGAALVAFSPLGRGFLAGALRSPGDLVEGDIRRGMARFAEPHFSCNVLLRERLRALADEAGVTLAQLALAWVMREPHVIPIPGTTSIDHLRENRHAGEIAIAPALLDRATALFDRHAVSGPRYSAATQAEIDTEEFAQ